MSYIQRLKRTGIVCLFPVVSYGILGPLEIYCGNEKDFSFGLTDFIWLFLGISVAVWLFSSLIFALFKDKINEKICAVILGIGVASYIQNMFMNIKLSEIDGSGMDWESLKSFSYLNIVIWGIIILLTIILSIALKKKWSACAMGIASFLSVIQLVAVVFLLISSVTRTEDTSNLRMSGEGQFEVAADHNIIVLVLDTLGNTQLENALKVYPDMLDGLSDFTFYNNADCRYYCTFPSMTHMLTGNDFDFDSNSIQWLNDSWQSDKANKFYDILGNNQYTCSLYSSSSVIYTYGDIDNLYKKFNNVKPADVIIDKRKMLESMGKMSIYKYFPYIMKPYFEILTHQFNDIVTLKEGESIIGDNAKFYEALNEKKLTVNSKLQNAFIIQHLFGTHQPYTNDENANFVEEATIEETIRGLIVICEEYLSQLKELGVYDDATVIITADHGSWYGNDPQPILFVKKAGETQEQMKVNSAPVSLGDFQATILSLIGEDYSEYGTSIFDWKESDERARTVYMRGNDENYPAVTNSSFNVYYEYSYVKDKDELLEKMKAGPDNVLMATPW